MKLLVCGSRTFTDTHLPIMEAALQPYAYIGSEHDVTLLHGDARGADRASEQVAKKWGWTVKRFPAEWDRLGRRAGLVRNLQMLSELDPKTDRVIAFWDRTSMGTAHTIEAARQLKIPVDVFFIEVN